MDSTYMHRNDKGNPQMLKVVRRSRLEYSLSYFLYSYLFLRFPQSTWLNI